MMAYRPAAPTPCMRPCVCYAWQLFVLVEQDFADSGGRCREVEYGGMRRYYMRDPADIGHIIRDPVAFPKCNDWKRLDKCG